MFTMAHLKNVSTDGCMSRSNQKKAKALANGTGPKAKVKDILDTADLHAAKAGKAAERAATKARKEAAKAAKDLAKNGNPADAGKKKKKEKDTGGGGFMDFGGGDDKKKKKKSTKK